MIPHSLLFMWKIILDPAALDYGAAYETIAKTLAYEVAGTSSEPAFP
jgi:hypothetical protein